MVFNVFADDDLFYEYNILYDDLMNFDTPGYKSSWDIDNAKGSNSINLSQGVLIKKGINTSLAIVGEGFFKIRLEDDVIGYTRSGEFYFDSDFCLVTGDGYKLYDNITVPAHFMEILFENNTFYALLPNGEKIESRRINVYTIDHEILIRYSERIFIAQNNFDSLSTNDSRVIYGCLENSNVNIIKTLIRMHIILGSLGNYGYDFNYIDQIIMMLINNIPIIDELTTIKIELSNIHERLLGDNAIIRTEDRTVTIFGKEQVFPGIEINPLIFDRMIYENDRYGLLRDSLELIKIE
jgi:flagellar basal body rod protein FlgF